MTRVLLTGGSGFIAAHVLESLLAHGYSVVTTVRSAQKGQQILDSYKQYGKDKLDYAIVEDISKPGAFDSAVVSDPPLEAAVHCASPYHFNAKTPEEINQLITTAVDGTTGILKAIKSHAPAVKRVIILSSYAAMVDYGKPMTHVYTEVDWNPITNEQAYSSAPFAYLASKTFAEKAAWEFIKSEKPNFTLTTLNPPMVYGPVIHSLSSLDSINTSNARFVSLLKGSPSTPCPPTVNYLFIDVRDLALAHVLALENPEAENQRFLVTAGNYSNAEIAQVIGEEYPEYKERMPVGEALKPGERPATGVNGYDNRRSIEILGMKYRPLRESVVGVVESIKRFL
ncbi:methylglyoxal reductase (NADPH-dependent) gre2 [Cadophora gregata]|uniref:methylglyoxal reductase (NADPH-dependent) gre2 n=1 Tax=Cadophora gregata TaxID=51156 RepID=UPI0026DD2FCE|nr:methylglyoxal reductase (NADPH-dependent) gre2 [Cadophora gregata]KAK0112804.1 methylglyoxal reductase (NADPH-dependent) gre2 [Cadophora gregata]KAK0124945.1 methylglyoxal reductase (NADPH-dependent) gre2 [Cadophora gregata f. sp. sojae]